MDTFSFKTLAPELPQIMARTEVKNYLGGVISAKTLANLDSLGLGPSGRQNIGSKVFYVTESLLEWLDERMAAGHLGCKAS